MANTGRLFKVSCSVTYDPSTTPGETVALSNYAADTFLGTLFSGTTVATGTAQIFDRPLRTFQVAKVVTGGTSVTVLAVDLQGSLDGTNWFALGSQLVATSTEYATIVDKPCIAVRANLTTVTATVAPTVTVRVAGV